jgi:hypothetical protein
MRSILYMYRKRKLDRIQVCDTLYIVTSKPASSSVRQARPSVGNVSRVSSPLWLLLFCHIPRRQEWTGPDKTVGVQELCIVPVRGIQ